MMADMPTSPAPAVAVATRIVAQAVDLVKVYGKGETTVTALDHVSAAFPAGQFSAIMGPSGSGKSTLMHCMAGLDSVTSGQVFVDGRDLSVMKDRALTALRRDKLGFIFQAYNLVPTLTALENINLPAMLAGRKNDQEWLDSVIDAVGLRDRLNHKPSELSGGQQQRVAAARALASQPAIVFADEPSGNLDSRSSAELLDFMRRAVRELGQTIVMVTHDPVSASYADRALFLDDGRIVDELGAPTAESVLDKMKTLGA